MKTLLEKAKKIPNNNRRHSWNGKEYQDLAIAWLKGELVAPQIAEVLGNKEAQTDVRYMCATALKAAYRDGRIVIKK